MSQWTEIRHMHDVEGVPKREIARRLGLDVRTVRRAVARTTAPTERVSPARGGVLDPHRGEIVTLLRGEPRLTAKRVRIVLRERHGIALSERAARRYVAEVRREVRPREAFAHRTHAPGDTMEVDFGESLALIAGPKTLPVVNLSTCSDWTPSASPTFKCVDPVERVDRLAVGTELRGAAGMVPPTPSAP